MHPRLRSSPGCGSPDITTEGNKDMSKSHARHDGLSQGQIRDIYTNKSGKTIRQLAIFYGVPERVINAARREQHMRRFPGKRGRIALVNA